MQFILRNTKREIKTKNDLRLGCRVNEKKAQQSLTEISSKLGWKVTIHWLHNVKSEPDVQLEHQENNIPAVNKTMGAFLILLGLLAQWVYYATVWVTI